MVVSNRNTVKHLLDLTNPSLGIAVNLVAPASAPVTGASHGLGEAIAIGYANAGADLVLTARCEDDLNRVAGGAYLLVQTNTNYTGHATHPGPSSFS